jgi:hypothetical protein
MNFREICPIWVGVDKNVVAVLPSSSAIGLLHKIPLGYENAHDTNH